MISIAVITIIVGALALLINIYGLIVAFIANSKFHGGYHKKIVYIVLALVVFLNVHIILNVYSNTRNVFSGSEAFHIAMDNVGFILVLIVSILIIVASAVNMMMAREHGFA